MISYIPMVVVGLISSGIIADRFNTVDYVNYELEREFKYMDINNNGVVELHEFVSAILMQDTNKDGCVSFTEFLQFRGANEPQQADNLFFHYDHNYDGCLKVQDVKYEYSEIDVNPKDGEVTLSELLNYYDKVFRQIGIITQS